MKRLLTCLLIALLVVCMVLPLASCGNKNPDEKPGESSTPTTDGPKDPATYTYNDSVSTLATNWNPHTYEVSDDSYPISFIATGLYDFFFNDTLKPIDGKDPFEGFVIVPEMAAAEPVDVTEAVKAMDNNKYGIPADATSGYAYKIALNPNAVWQDGTPINADTYVYSMKQLLDPVMRNYRSIDYTSDSTSLVVANGKAYLYQGSTEWADAKAAYTVADLVKGADGKYTTADGAPMGIAIDAPLSWLGGKTLKYYVEGYGDAYFNLTNWETILGMVDANGGIPLTDENIALVASVIATEAWGETEAHIVNYFATGVYWEDNYDFSNVGLFKSGDYEITLVLGKSLKGFQLLYNLTSNWIVYEPYYEANKKEVGSTVVSSYNTSVESTMSYGPYKMTFYQADSEIRFEKNEKWYGWTDGKHTYVDPEDGKTYDMYQTTHIVCKLVKEADTRKMMFLKGELMGYGLQASDFEEYINSDYVYQTPSETIYFLILNGNLAALTEREAEVDATKVDLQTMSLKKFKQAMAVTYDKELLADTISPARTGGYGLIGNNYIYDPYNALYYRESEQAMRALCKFYSVEVPENATMEQLEAAVKSITGYAPETAKVLFGEAFQEALEAGYITDADKDGKSDQTIRIEYCASAVSDFIQKTVDYLNSALAEVLVGTPFEGKIEYYVSAPYGTEWSNKLKAGLSDVCLAGWSGSALDPFGLSGLYTNPAQMYNAGWFDATGVDLTLPLGENGADLTMNLQQWSNALNGTTVEIDGKSYNFGEDNATTEQRLEILAAIENEILQTYDYIPTLQDASAALLSKQVYYVVDEYNPIMGRGGIAYMKYNYNDAQWAEYVASQPEGTLKY